MKKKGGGGGGGVGGGWGKREVRRSRGRRKAVSLQLLTIGRSSNTDPFISRENGEGACLW